MKRIDVLWLAALVWLLVPLGATRAAGFACGSAANEVEKTVCADPVLSRLDDELTRAYKRARSNAGVDAWIVRAQRQWLVVRDTCGDLLCLRSAYEQRVAQLTAAAELSDTMPDIARSRGLIFSCTYWRNGKEERELTGISSVGDYASRRPVATHAFDRAGAARQAAHFLVQAGEAAECVYPSGRRVRVKIGVGSARPYGYCGANPQVFLSLWVDRRKVESRMWFAGNCLYGAALVYSVVNSSPTRCWLLLPWESDDPRGPFEGSSRCYRLTGASNQPIDEIEYPAPDKIPPKPGTIEIARGNEEVCAFARAALGTVLAHNWDIAFRPYAPAHRPVPVPVEYANQLPEDFESAEATIYDLDNDGTDDVVFTYTSQSGYRDAIRHVVLLGQSTENAWSLPCRLEEGDHAPKVCPSLATDADAGFDLDSGNGEPLFFLGRYTLLQPFRFKDRTFIAVQSRVEDMQHLLPVLEPLPGKRMRTACLIREVQENF